MGRGLGAIQRTIIALFTQDPHAVLSTAELCTAVYGIAPQKRHRVAVLRALRSLDGRPIRLDGRMLLFRPGRVCDRADDLWYNGAVHNPSYGTTVFSGRTRPRRTR